MERVGRELAPRLDLVDAEEVMLEILSASLTSNTSSTRCAGSDSASSVSDDDAGSEDTEAENEGKGVSDTSATSCATSAVK